MEESIIAASAARNDHSVLHIDPNKYYGAEWAAFSFDGLQEWIKAHRNDGDENNAKYVKEDDTEAADIGIAHSAAVEPKEEDIELLLQKNEILFKTDNLRTCSKQTTSASTISNVTENWFIPSDHEEECGGESDSNVKETVTTEPDTGDPCVTPQCDELGANGRDDSVKETAVNQYSEGLIEGTVGVSPESASSSTTDDVSTATVVPTSNAEQKGGSNSNRNRWSRKRIFENSRKFNLDLTPRLFYSCGAMVELLLSSNISRYTEFKVSKSKVVQQSPYIECNLASGYVGDTHDSQQILPMFLIS